MNSLDLSHIHSSNTVVCDNPSCCCEGESCENFLTSVFKTDKPPCEHNCHKDCSSCLCTKVKDLSKYDCFKFSVIDDSNIEDLVKLHPDIAIDEERNASDEIMLYSNNLPFTDLVRKFKVSKIQPVVDYTEIHAYEGVSCGGCMSKIHKVLEEEVKKPDSELFVRSVVQTKKVDMWSSDLIDRMKIKERLPSKFAISFYSYFEISPINCGGCIKNITEKLQLDIYRSYEFKNMRYLKIESEKPLDANMVKSMVESMGKTVKIIPALPYMRDEEEEEEGEDQPPLEEAPSALPFDTSPIEVKSVRVDMDSADDSDPIQIIVEEDISKKSCCSGKKSSCCSEKNKKKKESCCSSKNKKDDCCSSKKKKEECSSGGDCCSGGGGGEDDCCAKESEHIDGISFPEIKEDDGDPLSIILDDSSTRLVLLVDGMTCGNCCTKVKNFLLKQKGIFTAEVVMLSTKAFITYDPEVIDEETIISRVTKIGFPSTKVMEIATDGEVILCIENSKKNEINVVCGFFEETDDLELLEKKESSSRKHLFSKKQTETKFHIRFEGKWTPRKIIEEAYSQYKVKLCLEKGTFKTLEASLMKKKEIRFYFWHFVFSAIFTIPAMIFALLFGNIRVIGGTPKVDYDGTGIYFSLWRAIKIKTVVLIILCTPVQLISGFVFYKKAFKLLIFSRSLDKNSLITVSCWTAYIVSIVSVVYGMFDSDYIGKNYMEGSAMLICFLLLGQWLENIATRKTSLSIVKLLKLQPDTAFLVTEPSACEDIMMRLNEEKGVTAEEVDVNLLWPGDVVEVKIGCKIPTDGIVVYGSSEVNQSMVTGESVYVKTVPGSEVIGGTVNITHSIFVRITKSTQNNMLSKIVKMIEEAQMNKPKIQDALDKVSVYFVPIVIGISIAVLIFWLAMTLSGAIPSDWLGRNNPVIFSILQATSTLVIACPCALGLAVPLVIMVSNGIGAKYGVLIKGGHSFEKLNKSTVICFDKTGTLTQGKLSIEKVMLFNKTIPKAALMASIAAAENSISSHPIAQTIIDYVVSTHSEEDLNEYKPLNFKHVNGQGLKCQIKPILSQSLDGDDDDDRKGGTSELLVGNLRLLESYDVKFDRETVCNLCEGRTLVVVALDKEIVAIFTLIDQLRPEIKKVIKKLRKKWGRKKILMLTGDNEKVAMRIGSELGMKEDEIFSELTPIGKSEAIRNLQRKREVVVFVGDGVNDSVGLSQADVGVSLKSGTEIAIECSNIVLMKDTMLTLLLTFNLAKASYRRIQLNVFWAFFYNVVTIPIAAGILFPIPGFRIIVPPWICAILMTLSCLSVTFNTILFRIFYRPNKSLKDAILESEKDSKKEKDSEDVEIKPLISNNKSLGEEEDKKKPIVVKKPKSVVPKSVVVKEKPKKKPAVVTKKKKKKKKPTKKKKNKKPVAVVAKPKKKNVSLPWYLQNFDQKFEMSKLKYTPEKKKKKKKEEEEEMEDIPLKNVTGRDKSVEDSSSSGISSDDKMEFTISIEDGDNDSDSSDIEDDD